MSSSKQFVKALLRSGSPQFAKAFSRNSTGPGIGVLQWRGSPFHYRHGTSDAFVGYECLLKGRRNAYHSALLPAPERVKTVVDVGANIGASVLFWRKHYPAARIIAFEPVPENFAVLQMNTSGLGNVQAHQEALADADGEAELVHSPAARNEGGWSLYQRGAGREEQRLKIRVRESGARLRELGVERIDVIKVDTEGAEKRILKGLGAALLAGTGYICGELHGERDFELLDFLEQHGFSVGCRKQAKRTLFNFEALRLGAPGHPAEVRG